MGEESEESKGTKDEYKEEEKEEGNKDLKRNTIKEMTQNEDIESDLTMKGKHKETTEKKKL